MSKGDAVSPGVYDRKQRIRELADLRWVSGPSILIDSKTHKFRYPPDEIGAVLRKVQHQARKLGIDFPFSADEKKFWLKMVKLLIVAGGLFWLNFPDINRNGVPDVIEEFLKGGGRETPDWVERTLGLLDNKIEKYLELPAHKIEQNLGAKTDLDKTDSAEKDS